MTTRPSRKLARGRALAAVAVALALVVTAHPARAYDPATTHAGLTERAVVASALHRLLAGTLGRSLGLFEPLQIHSRTMTAEARRVLWDRLGALDPAGGYRPDSEGTASALSWVVAGAVLAKTPPELGRHHFFEPGRRTGLDDSPGLTGFTHAVRLSLDKSTSVRDVATGLAFDLTGQSSLAWLQSPLNDQAVPSFHEHWARAVSAADPAARESALVHALISLGGILAVLQDAGEPAHVRNDFRAAFLQRRGSSSWDRASAYERFVAARYGRAGVPAAGAPVRRPSLEAYFTGTDGNGLADRTQRRFFSAGTLPEDAPVETTTTTRDVVEEARGSLGFARPTVGRLELREPGRKRYMFVEGLRALGYLREPGRVRFFLDAVVYADAARALLPEIGAYAAGLLDHLTRARVSGAAAGGHVTLMLEGASGTVKQAAWAVYAEDAAGNRRELALPTSDASQVGARELAVPAGAKKIAVVVRGQDAAGPFVATGEIRVP